MKYTVGFVVGQVHYETVEADSPADAKNKVGDSLSILDDDAIVYMSCEPAEEE